MLDRFSLGGIERQRVQVWHFPTLKGGLGTALSLRTVIRRAQASACEIARELTWSVEIRARIWNPFPARPAEMPPGRHAAPRRFGAPVPAPSPSRRSYWRRP